MSDKTDAWMPLWIGAYLADTTHLSRDQHGGYLLLLMAYWRKRAALPDDDGQLAQIAKATPSEWKRLRPILSEFFAVRGGAWWHKRVEQEMADADERAEKAASKASRAGQARWKDHTKHSVRNASSNAPSIPQASTQALPKDVLKECPTPSPTPLTSKASDANASGGKPPDAQDLVFALGVPLLTAANVSDRNARSMLAALCKQNGPAKVADAIQRCATEKPIQPVPWLQAALKPRGARQDLSRVDYREGVTEDGTV